MSQAIIEGEVDRVREYKDITCPSMEVYLDGYDWVRFCCEGALLEKYRSLLVYPNMLRLEGEFRFHPPTVFVFEVFKDHWPPESERLQENQLTVRGCIVSVKTIETQDEGHMIIIELKDLSHLCFVLFTNRYSRNIEWLKMGETIGFRGFYQSASSEFSIETVQQIHKPLVESEVL